MMLNTLKGRVFFAAILIVELVLIIFGITYRRTLSRYESLLSGVTADTIVEIALKPSFPTSFEVIDGLVGFLAVPTGKLANVTLTDTKDGINAQATLLEVVTRDKNGKPKRLDLIIQLFPLNNTDRNLMPWVIENVARLGPIDIKADKPVSLEELSGVFPEGTLVSFAPLVYLDREEINEFLPEYISYASGYYAGSTSAVKKFFEDGMVSNFRKPILILDTGF